jgi:hypothetical protein
MKARGQKTQSLTKGIIAAVILFIIILLVSPFVVPFRENGVWCPILEQSTKTVSV